MEGGRGGRQTQAMANAKLNIFHLKFSKYSVWNKFYEILCSNSNSGWILLEIGKDNTETKETQSGNLSLRTLALTFNHLQPRITPLDSLYQRQLQLLSILFNYRQYLPIHYAGNPPTLRTPYPISIKSQLKGDKTPTFQVDKIQNKCTNQEETSYNKLLLHFPEKEFEKKSKNNKTKCYNKIVHLKFNTALCISL